MALSAMAVFLIVGGLVGAAFASTEGFATYGLTFQANGVSKSVTVNESVSAGQSPSLEVLDLSVIWSSGSFNYSRQVNATIQPFPYVPALSNQNFSLTYQGSSLTAKLAQNGTTPIIFHGGSYELTSYAFTASVSSDSLKGSGEGSFATFPSGLLYSLNAEFNGTASVQVTLLATSLPLTSGGSNSALQTASVGLGAGAAVSVLALSLGFRSKHRQKHMPENKPAYWVD